MKMELDEPLRQQLTLFQRNEITEHHIYTKLAGAVSPENRQVLEQIAADELRHYHEWKKCTRQDVQPDRLKIWGYYVISRVLGITFGIQLMERGEEKAESNYRRLRQRVEEAEAILRDEEKHEAALIGLLDEEWLRYVGSIVLGLNDALVELTGALAGLTLALQDTRLIALSGTITGIAAALSMGASEYLSTKSEETAKEPLKASIYLDFGQRVASNLPSQKPFRHAGGIIRAFEQLGDIPKLPNNPLQRPKSSKRHYSLVISLSKVQIYTGVAYIATVLILILPYLFLDNFYICLVWALTAAVLIIAMFNYYISVVKDEPFKKRFLEMAGMSLGVASLSFLVGYVVRTALGVEI